MKQRNPLSIRYIALFALPVFLGGLFFFYRTHATPLPSSDDILNANQGLLLYSGGADGNFAVQSLESSSTSQIISDFGNSQSANNQKWLYLSPDRKLIAITLNPTVGDAMPSTFIASANGSQVTRIYPGMFVSWAPDSSKVLLYVSPMEAPWERKIYALDARGNYSDTGLPNGTIDADVSPVDGSIAYSFTSGGTDASTIYLRDPKGNDKLLVQSDNTILSWIRWSPKGDRIAFLKSDRWISADQQSAWVMNPDGTEVRHISKVDWGYPAVWSPDSTKLAFANAGNIWEYDATADSLTDASNFSQAGATHPSYSADGKTLIFSSNASGESQIWAAQNGGSIQLTHGGIPKDYPLLP